MRSTGMRVSSMNDETPCEEGDPCHTFSFEVVAADLATVRAVATEAFVGDVSALGAAVQCCDQATAAHFSRGAVGAATVGELIGVVVRFDWLSRRPRTCCHLGPWLVSSHGSVDGHVSEG